VWGEGVVNARLGFEAKVDSSAFDETSGEPVTVRRLEAGSVRRKPVRVLHVITRLITGGADENTVLTVEGLDRRCYAVTLAAGPDSEKEMVARLERTPFLTVPCLQRELHPFKDLCAFVQLARILKREKVQLLHTHEAKAGILGRLAAWCTGVPVVVHTLHGITFHRHLPAPLRWTYLLLEKLAAKRTDFFICVGEDLKRTYIRNRIGDPSRYAVVRSGFDTKRFQRAARDRDRCRAQLRHQLKLSKDVTIVGSVARLEPRKGVQYLIRAAQKLHVRWPDVHFTVAGQGSYQGELERLVREVGLQGHFHFLGFVEHVESYLAGLDIFALSSLWEGLPRALVQAGIVGLPVVTFDVEGAWEVVQDGETGFIVPSKDVDALAERIAFLLERPALANEMGRKAQVGLAGEWDERKMVLDIENIYGTLLLRGRVLVEEEEGRR